MQYTRSNQRFMRLCLVILGLALIGISAYLTQHYFQVHFPKQLSSGSFCDISKFWNCDSAAFSPFSNILNVPTALFGALFGVIIFFGALYFRAPIHQTNYFLAIINFLGCIILFFYSLFFLNGLCPGCTVYYLLSLLVLIIFFLCSPLKPIPKLSYLLLYATLAMAMGIGSFFYNKERHRQQDEVMATWINQVRAEKVYDENMLDFAFPLAKATDNFADAPLRITLFSDFQCPFCRLLENEIDKAASRFKGKLNVRYVFFPLDSKCNAKVATPMHPFACDAARLAYCARDKFETVHDKIYDHQNEINSQWLNNEAKDLGVIDCYSDDKSKIAVKELIDKTHAFSLEAAPTMLINGRKISGLIPAKAIVTLLDALLKN